MNFVKYFELFGVVARQIACITGEGPPTESTEGAVGCLYMDTLSKSKDVYMCVAVENGVCTWVSLLGDLDSALAEILDYAQSLTSGGES